MSFCIVNFSQGSVCIINAASDRDVAVFAAGMIQANLITYYSSYCLFSSFFSLFN